MPKPDLEVGEIIELKIDKLTFGGSGLGRYRGLVIFVPLSAPGDHLQAEIVEVKRNFAIAKVRELLEPSLDRRVPPCPAFGLCGGCDWQHLRYEAQAQAKEDILTSTLEQHRLIPAYRDPLLKASAEWRYRNRVQVQVEGGRLGFRKKQSHQVIEVEDCLIAQESVVAQFPDFRAQASGRYEIRSDEGVGFAQVNEAQNAMMISTLRNWISQSSVDLFLDLYCGQGNLTFPLSKESKARRTIGVEGEAAAIALAEQRAQNAGVEGFRFIAQPVDRFLKEFSSPEKDVGVCLDPPRAGCDRSSLEKIWRLKPLWVLYVSCDPMTWARDVQYLLSQDPSLNLVRVQALDMFPQTTHIEVLSLLMRSA